MSVCVHTYVYTDIKMRTPIHEHGRLSIFANVPYLHAKLPFIIKLYMNYGYEDIYTHIYIHTHMYTYIQIHTHIFINISVCL